jgi:hypothetical protein
MTTQILTAKLDTIIKQSTRDSRQITNPSQKFPLAVAETLEINHYQPAANNHWQLELTFPINGSKQWFAYKPHVTITGTPTNVIIFRGKMSIFGGPNDSGVSPSEGLALIQPHQMQEFQDYFLPTQPPNTTGLARRLDPDTFYLACRWNYNQTSKSFLVKLMVTVTNPSNGRTAQAKPVDWGPHKDTGRDADLSPGLANFLGLKTDDNVEVIVPLPSP